MFSSRFASIVGTKKQYCFLCIPGKCGVYVRQYICLSCNKCRKLDFLNCTTEYFGPWKFHVFYLNQKTLKQLFYPIFGDSNNLIMKIIGGIYRALPIVDID